MRRCVLALLTLSLLALPAAADAKTPSVGIKGFGPLQLGMSRADAVATGWLAHRGKGCPVASPVPTTYRVDGAKAPSGVKASAEFTGGKLTNLTFDGGVRTAAGVRVGTTVKRMLARYKALGFTARANYQTIFDSTFVTVARAGKQVLGAVATGGVVRSLSIPASVACE